MEQIRLDKKHVVLCGVDIPFWDLVNLLFKTALAAIPAVFLLSLTVGGAVLALSILKAVAR